MPIYEYYCAECQTKFDARRPMSKAECRYSVQKLRKRAHLTHVVDVCRGQWQKRQRFSIRPRWWFWRRRVLRRRVRVQSLIKE